MKNYVTITFLEDEDSWRQLLGILAEVTHGSESDQKLINAFTAKVNMILARQIPQRKTAVSE